MITSILADAVLELQQVRFRGEELGFAQLLEVVLAHFSDSAAGGFYFTSDDHETLIHRSKSFSDDATPAGNGIAACVLQRLGHLLGEPRYLAAAERTLRAAWPALLSHPHAHTTLLTALEELLHPPAVVIIRGAPALIEAWRTELAKLYAPGRLVLAIPADVPDLPRRARRQGPARGHRRLRLPRQQLLGAAGFAPRSSESCASLRESSSTACRRWRRC